MGCLIIITRPEELTINVCPNIELVLPVNQNASVTHPIIPAVIDPSRVLFKTKNIEYGRKKHRKMLFRVLEITLLIVVVTYR
jgi:hypothetical protein